MSDAGEFAYSNRSEREPGRLVSLAGLVLRGVPLVQAQVAPYAEEWERSNRAALGRPGPLWVALGDSLTQGIGAPAFDRGWVGQLRERLAAAGHDYRVVNLAVSGARTQDVLDKQLPALAALAARQGLPELVTLMIGSNDLVSRRHRAGLPERFHRILAQLPSGTVVTTLPNPTATAAAVNRVIAAAAERRGLRVAELREPRTASCRGRLAADHFHPNERGYAALTDVLADVLADVVR